MTFRRLGVSLLSVCALVACTSDDTVVALNVTSGDEIPVVDILHVTVTQGTRRYVHDFAPPIETPTGENAAPPSIRNQFFERMTLPDSFEGAAVLRVEAQHLGGVAFVPPLSDETTITIEPNEVVAAYVKLGVPMTPVDPAMGAAGAAGADGIDAAGAGGAAGASGAGGIGDSGAGGG